ncbi:hypothetical protein GCM10023189_39910 [Nibrella saemangeumensis]|uniref:Sigma-54 modulation protein n=1 Tax=Nibrella saemangeumensis TaxID=1084526 RepID=A0ABP8N7R4_9BACT
MRLQINAVHFSADQKLLDFVQRKLDKLDTYYDRITGAEVFLMLDGASSNKVKDKVVEVRLSIPGKEIFVSEQDKTFEGATDRLVDVLKDKLVRFKQKRNGHSRQEIVEARAQMRAEAVEPEEL